MKTLQRPWLFWLGLGLIALAGLGATPPAGSTASAAPPQVAQRSLLVRSADGLMTATPMRTGTPPTATPTRTTTPTGTITRTRTPAPSPTCGGPTNIRILIVYADTDHPPITIQAQLLAQPGVTAVDLFDGQAGTPALGLLDEYTVVVPMSNFPFADPTTLGNNLADYLDAAGIVVGQDFSWWNLTAIQGRWQTGGYSPWDITASTNFSPSTLGTYTPGHPLMDGVTTLDARVRSNQTLASGATSVALYADNVQLIAYKGRAIGVNAYVGNYPYGGTYWSGDFAQVIGNAVRWLAPGTPCASSTPTPTCSPGTLCGTPTATRTAPAATRSATPTAVPNTPTATRTATPSGPSATPTCSPGTLCSTPTAVPSTPTATRTAPPPGLSATPTAIPSTVTPTPTLTCGPGPLCGSPTAAPPSATRSATPLPSAVPSTPTPTRTATPPGTATAMATATATATAGCGGPAGPPGPWTPVAPYQTPFESPAVATDGTYLYSAGGYAGAVTNTLGRYDPVANAWTYLASMPGAVYEARAAYAPSTNAVYVFGGYNGGVLSTTYIYNIASNTWSTGAALPAARIWPDAAYSPATGKIYVIGGLDSGENDQSQTWEYDPVANTWNTARASSPATEGSAMTAVSGQYIYLMGGYGGSFGSTNHYRYDVLANTWAALAPLPQATGMGGGANIDGKNYLYGGGAVFLRSAGADRTHAGGTAARPNAAPSAYANTYIYNIAGNTWSAGPNLTSPHSYTNGTNVGNRLIITGGYNGTTGDTDIVEMSIVPFTPCPSATPTPTLTCGPGPLCGSPTAAPPSATPSPTATPSGPPPPTATPTPCTINFVDVFTTDYFYEPVRYLVCHGVISGYVDGTFRPGNNVTRSQMTKIVVLAFHIPITTPTGGAYTFTDVPSANPFFSYVETAAAHNLVSGYTCGAAPAGPCDAQNRAYFSPYANVTRGQFAKIDVVARGWGLLNPSIGSFEDVLPNTAFYRFVETAYCHDIISGYDCGDPLHPGEPCGNPARPYFRQFNPATRGEAAKIVYLTLTNPPNFNCFAPPASRASSIRP